MAFFPKYRHVSRTQAEKAIRNIQRKVPKAEQEHLVKKVKWEFEYRSPHGHWAAEKEKHGKKFNW